MIGSKPLRKSKWIYFILKFLLSGFFLLVATTAYFMYFPEKVINYLSVNSPIGAESLVVEGWISDPGLEEAIQTARNGNYRQIITTGGPLAQFVTLFQNGYLAYNFNGSEALLTKLPDDTLSILMSGTPVNEKFPHFIVLIEGLQIGEGYVQESMLAYQFPLSQFPLPEEIEKICIVFDNDETGQGEDRNLSIELIRIGKLEFPARSTGTAVYTGSFGNARFEFWTNVDTYADKCRERMISAGISSDLIISVPSPESETNRTMTSALSLAKWMGSGNHIPVKYNVLTEGIHARRTWYLYKSALKNYALDVGVISVNNMAQLSTDKKLLRSMMIREIIGNIYYRVFFRKRKFREAFFHENFSA